LRERVDNVVPRDIGSRYLSHKYRGLVISSFMLCEYLSNIGTE